MNLDKAALDKYLTTPPDNGYDSWIELVWDKIPETEISGDEMEKHDAFFQDLQLDISMAGGSRFVDTQFAADCIISRYKKLLRNPECKTWAELKAKIDLHNL